MRRVVALLMFGLLPATQTVEAQNVDCGALKARIDASSGSGVRAGQYASALRRQRYELQRTQDYADQIGCNSNFLFNTAPAECDAVAARLERMQANVAQLQEQTQGGGDEVDRRQALTAQYNAYCAGRPPDGAQASLSQDHDIIPVDPDAPPLDEGGPVDGDARPHRVRALCVRECDGGFFPITDEASSGSLDDLDRLCKAQCPNTKASLYTAAPSAGLETAVAADGTPYTSLPTAFKFQKSFDATCSCKPQHQTWVEALAEAEKLIKSGHDDVTVTQRMSDAMSRPATSGPTDPNASPPRPSQKVKIARKAKVYPPPSSVSPDRTDQDPPQVSDTFGGDLTRQLRRDAPTL